MRVVIGSALGTAVAVAMILALRRWPSPVRVVLSVLAATAVTLSFWRF